MQKPKNASMEVMGLFKIKPLYKSGLAKVTLS